MYFQSSIFHGNNSPYIKLAFYSVSVRQGTYTRCRTNNKKKKNGKMKTQKKVKRKKRQISFTIQLELVSCLFISRFHSLPNESIDHIITRQSIRRKIIQYLQFEQKKSNLSPWMSSTFWHVHIERRKVVWDEHASIDQMIKKREKKKKRLTIPKIDRLSVNFDSNESWLTNIQFVNEARSRPDLIYK